ncbi:Putative F-box/LRR-repeat protein At3g28410 [Linum grandiflorum]
MEGDDDSCIDRLSNIPEEVIHHILSFLNTNSAVQTSVLSRRWRHAWKHLSVLDFLHYRHRMPLPRFNVHKVLSLRYRHLNLRKVVFHDDIVQFRTVPEGKSLLFANVSRYALSHGVQHLEIVLNSDDYELTNPSVDSLGFNSDNSSRLKTLKLELFSFSNSFQRYGNFLALEILDLCFCTFFVGPNEVLVDPFSSLPSLKHLELSNFKIGDNADARFRISGLELLSLRLIPDEFHKMEIHAPKLERFYIEYIHLVEFAKLTLPSLDHAHIEVLLR